MEKLRIVFMGTPEFAVGILDALCKNNYDVVGVITAADKPSGRGQQVKFSAVKEYALKNHLKLLQPVNLKEETFLKELSSLDANLQVVVAFRMLPKLVWSMPKFGTFNLHASLLPNYRGAAPINWAIINGETKTGVTTFFIDEKIDTGAMILQKEIAILENENAGSLHDRLMQIGCKAVLETVQLIESNNVTTTIQVENQELKTAHKLNKDNCKIDWQKSGKEIINLINGLSPYPCSWSFFDDVNFKDVTIKIYEAQFYPEQHDCKLGKVILSKKDIKVAIHDGFVTLIELQFPGKKKMKALELLNGVHFSDKALVK
jgi:methionyl-tRNA formyltransferase